MLHLNDFRNMTATIKDNTADLIVADWPFNKGIINKDIAKLYHDGVSEASRLVSNVGNFVSIHYPVNNTIISSEAFKYGFKLIDANIIQLVRKIKSYNQVGRGYITIYSFSKSPMTRLFNDPSVFRGRYSRSDFVLTDLWEERQFRNGYWNKEYNENIPEAMPKSIVCKILDLYTKQDSLVVDYFGGSGNFLIECKKRNINCITSENNIEHYNIIKRRLASLSIELLNKASNEYTNKGLKHGKAEEKKKTWHSKS